MKCKLFIIIVGILLSVSSVVTPQTERKKSSFDLEYVKKVLTKEIRKILKETGMPSISVALVKDDKIVYADAFGYVNVKKQVPATSQSVYNTGSTFKVVTSLAIMQLADAGKLSIDEPVNKYLKTPIKDLSDKGEPVTLRHFLSHHSGLGGPDEDYVPLWDRTVPGKLEGIVSQISVLESPGRKYEYVNYCYALAGLIIENVSQKSFQDYLVENLFKKLDIGTRGPVVPIPEMIEELALPYSIIKNKPYPETQYRIDVFPAGDIYLTSSDMAKFLMLLLNEGKYKGEEIIKQESIKEMETPQFKSNYGFGVEVYKKVKETRLEHSGAVPGYMSYFKINLNSKSGVYIMTNCVGRQEPLMAICDLSLSLLSGKTDVKPLQSFTRKFFNEIILPEKVLEKYVGKYQMADNAIIDITMENKELFAQKTGDDKVQLIPYEENKFFVKPGEGQFIFRANEKGDVAGLKFVKYEEVNEGKKIK